jgi:hypothetical protein
MPPTDRNDSRDRSRSHTVGSTMMAATRMRLCAGFGAHETNVTK